MNKQSALLTTIILTFIVANSSLFCHAQDSTKTFVPIVNYTADLVVNTRGGIKTGAQFLGFAEGGVEINPWKNGQFNLTLATTHGDEPSAFLVGDWQLFDNIEAGSYIFLYNAWYSHTFNKVTVKVGLQDANDSYSTCDASSNMLNTSFGGNQVLLSAGNIPTMPNNDLGITAEWKVSNTLKWQAGIFNGAYIALGDGNKFNLKHKLSSSNGYVIVSEADLNPNDALLLKVGAFYHTGFENRGYYASCEKSFQINGNRAINAYITGGYAPRACEDVANASITCGASLSGLFNKSGADVLGVGLASMHIDGYKWETALELNYLYQINDHFYASPDLQWIINPGVYLGLKNALVATLRLGYEL